MEPPLPSSFCGETVRKQKVPVLALSADTLAPAIPAGLNHSDVGSGCVSFVRPPAILPSVS